MSKTKTYVTNEVEKEIDNIILKQRCNSFFSNDIHQFKPKQGKILTLQ